MIEVAIILGIVAVAAFLMLRKDDAQDPPLVMTVHGNSALAGGYITPDGVHFYDPSPVHMLQEGLPHVRVVNCAQNGLTFAEALAGGPVQRGQPVLGQTEATCTALSDVWMDVRPTHAYIALGEIEPLLDPEWTAHRLAHQITDAVQQARALGVQPILQGCIRFREGGPVTREGLRACDLADEVIEQTARNLGVPFVNVRRVSFDPETDVAADGLHPTADMHARYSSERVNQLEGILA